MERLRGTVERITYQSPETGYTVARLQREGGSGQPVTVVGEMLALSPGECVVLEGDWANHSQYGRQFKISTYQTVVPATVAGIRKYLGSGLIKGVGPVTARRIVDHFGAETLRVIEETPDRLTEVEGLGRKRAEMILRAWEEQREIHNVMLFLQSHDVGTGYAVKIWKTYGQEAVSAIQENPYRLPADIWGIGFLTADRIAQKLGVEPHSEQRIQAGIRYVLDSAADDGGHVYLPCEELLQACVEALEVSSDVVAESLEALRAAEEVIVEGGRAYIPPLYYAEKGAAGKLHQLSRISRIEPGDVGREVEGIERRAGITFAPLQKKALERSLSASLLVLTGGPGTGKTTTIQGLIWLQEARNKRIALAAPTGRAAKRLSEATGREAKTIHRLLKFSPRDMAFEKNADDPLEIDALIVDEVSMVDITLMNGLMRAIPPSASVVLVGDVDQLPSVGPGNVLKDTIASGVVPTVELNEIFRQAQQSRIVMNAHAVNAGEAPDIRNARDSNFFFVEEEDPEAIAETICGLCAERLPRTYGLDPVDDIQVLAPMYRGEAGATNLNQALQRRLNPSGEELTRGGVVLRSGDKVMQVRNNYDREVFNGDIGRISAIDSIDQKLRVAFPDRVVDYDFADLDEIVLAYATTVHKSQGSEYRAVVAPMTTQHYIMLQRNLLYTAITRARELVVLVGTRKAMGIAVRDNQVSERYTSLSERIRSGGQGGSA
ncbi:MAG: ATP-dependent RecD-like DNA helicase [Candidatus Latescibacteria bacterium]|jgi:exodeoxyribonuclease V alpha subunit|nr:ATP-dependent RecD-like DNA helicase [Candidatus Latescibacterota bacterium]